MFKLARQSTTSFLYNGIEMFRANHWSRKGYSTCTFSTAAEAATWLTIMRGKSTPVEI